MRELRKGDVFIEEGRTTTITIIVQLYVGGELKYLWIDEEDNFSFKVSNIPALAEDMKNAKYCGNVSNTLATMLAPALLEACK